MSERAVTLVGSRLIIMQALLFDKPNSELVDLEWKKGEGGLPSSLWETFSAMANTHGGVIEVGVDDNGRTVGLKKPELRRKEFFDTVNNRQKISASLVSDEDVSVEEREGGKILRIRVPRAGRRKRPVYLNNNPMTGTFRRAGEGDYRCSEEEDKRMFSDQNSHESGGDGRALAGFTLGDLDDDSISHFRNRVSSRLPEHPAIQLDTTGMLLKIRAMHRDRDNGQIRVTVAGLLMFGKSESIQDTDAVPSFHLDYREASDVPEDRYKDRVTIDGMWAGNLFQFYRRVVPKLEVEPTLKVPFALDSRGVRRETTPQQEAIREALVNALIHADHRGPGGVVIEKLRDRLDFSNPGTLLVSPEQFFRGGVSECRNPRLQRMFQMLGLGEKAGSGIDVIRRGWRAQAWRTPTLLETARPDRVRLIMPMVSLMPKDVVAGLRHRFGSIFERLSEPEAQAVVTAQVEGFVTNARLCQVTESHPADATKLFQRLVSDGLLAAEGYGRGVTYRVPSNSHPDGPPPIMQDDHARILQDDPARILQVSPIRAQPSASASTKSVENSIIELTRQQFLSAKAIAEHLHRSPTDLRARFIGPMVENGVLKSLYPDKPSHRGQAYMAAE